MLKRAFYGVMLTLALTPAWVQASQGNNWHRAVLIDRMQTIQELVARGQNVNEPTPSGKTALMSAAKVGDLAFVERLIEAGADVNAANAKGGTVLMYAMLSGDTVVVDRILRAGATLDDLTTTGWSAMMIASAKNYAALIGVLLEHGADANQQDIYGWTPLIKAAHEGFGESVSRLLKAPKIDLEVTDENGLSALHHAAMSGHLQIVKTLLGAGADTALQDVSGKKPQQLAMEAGHANIAELLSSEDPTR
ncbi:MAG: ankyrin repeat domain-containing protein [Gammaproteobacteria bacterium]|nr:ankyrin repeat domain-containing protein [Gammaproteobacteria bacterium]